jgi:hypothetical protein
MSRRNRILFFMVAWLIVLMPFLFWHSTWFGRPLSDKEITQYLHDDAHPRHIQHALVQIGERLSRSAPGGAPANNNVAQWYPDLVRLTSHPVEEIRTTDAWVIGQAPLTTDFHQALLKLLSDAAFNVRANAGLALVRYGDASGHAQIVAMLQPLSIPAPISGRVAAVAKAGDPIRAATMVARIDGFAPTADSVEARSPITGTLRSVNVKTGDQVSTGANLATVSPGTDQLWEALRALVLIGTPDDLVAVRACQRPQPNVAGRVRQQAIETEKAILEREAK